MDGQKCLSAFSVPLLPRLSSAEKDRIGIYFAIRLPLSGDRHWKAYLSLRQKDPPRETSYLVRGKEWRHCEVSDPWLSPPAIPKGGAQKVSDRALILLWRLGYSPIPRGSPSCSCPIHALLVRGTPFSWATFGGCICRLHCLRVLGSQPGPLCLAIGPIAAPLSDALTSAILVQALRHAEPQPPGALSRQLTPPWEVSPGRNEARRPLTTLTSLVDRAITGIQRLPPQEIRNQARPLRLFIVGYRALLQEYSGFASQLNRIICRYPI